MGLRSRVMIEARTAASYTRQRYAEGWIERQSRVADAPSRGPCHLRQARPTRTAGGSQKPLQHQRRLGSQDAPQLNFPWHGSLKQLIHARLARQPLYLERHKGRAGRKQLQLRFQPRTIPTEPSRLIRPRHSLFQGEHILCGSA